jgi:hypothetical protein
MSLTPLAAEYGGCMKGFGILCMIGGTIWVLISFNLDTSVSTGLGRVNNLGLMADRQSYLTMAMGTIVVGVLLFIFGGKNSTKQFSSTPDVSPDASTNKSDAPKNKSFYEGKRDIDVDGYKLYLVKTFQITKNDVLGQFVLGEQLFPTLEESLRKADQLDRALQAEVTKRKEEESRTGTLGNCSMKYVINPDDTVTVSAGTWSKTYSNLAAAVEAEGSVNGV